jgi:hypothetical protein
MHDSTGHAYVVNACDWLPEVLQGINSKALVRGRTLQSHKIDISTQAKSTTCSCSGRGGDARQKRKTWPLAVCSALLGVHLPYLTTNDLMRAAIDRIPNNDCY